MQTRLDPNKLVWWVLQSGAAASAAMAAEVSTSLEGVLEVVRALEGAAAAAVVAPPPGATPTAAAAAAAARDLARASGAPERFVDATARHLESSVRLLSELASKAAFCRERLARSRWHVRA